MILNGMMATMNNDGSIVTKGVRNYMRMAQEKNNQDKT